MRYEFSYNGKVISYEIIRKPVKNINIRVKPSGEVFVSCNENVDNKTIELLMIKRANWLINTIEQFKVNLIEFTDANLKLVDGEEFLLLGKVLRIKNVEAEEFKVDYDNNYLYIYRPNQRGVKTKFNEWYSKFMMEKFTEMVDQSYVRFQKYGIVKPTVIYKNMRTRWGTCNIDKKVITLNTQLLKVDPFLTEYVICHELTHLKHRNHNKDFYSFLTSIVPDWKQREKILNNIFINVIGG